MHFTFLRPALMLSAVLVMTALSAAATDISFIPANLGPAAPANEQLASEVVVNALTLAGLRYTYGGQSLTTGMDCSALVQHVFRESVQRELPRTSEEQSRVGELVQRNELQAGDLVFFNTRGRRFSHVGIYVGEGRFVHAPRTGSAVRMESMEKAYWIRRFNGARRIVHDAIAQAPQKIRNLIHPDHQDVAH